MGAGACTRGPSLFPGMPSWASALLSCEPAGREGWRKAGTERGLQGGWIPPACFLLVCSSVCLSLVSAVFLMISLSAVSLSPRCCPAYFTSCHSFCLYGFVHFCLYVFSLCFSLCLSFSLSLFLSVSLSLSSFSLYPSPHHPCPSHIPILTLADYTLTWPSGVPKEVPWPRCREGLLDRGNSTCQGPGSSGRWWRLVLDKWTARWGRRAGIAPRAPGVTLEVLGRGHTGNMCSPEVCGGSHSPGL